MEKSKRKPYNDNAGYVASLKSKHPRLPGHFVIYDREAVPAPDIDADDRWVVMHHPRATMLACRSLRAARDVMKAMAGGANDFDFGQYDDG